MTLHPLEGHEPIRSALARGFESNRLPATLLFHGPAGVGKQRLALWTGQRLLCEADSSGVDEGTDRPCGACRGCHLAVRIEHPDLHWYFPIPKPPARGSSERDREALEEARQEELARIREQPLRTSAADPEAKPRALHLGTVQNLLREVARRPAMSTRRLFIVADAEALAAQESSMEAANALLKALEEPPEGTWFILTASEPGRLLPTIRSRATSVHVPRLPDEKVRSVLGSMGTEEEVDKAVTLAGGSIGRALGFLPHDGEIGPLERVRQDGFRLLRAALEGEDRDRFSRALSVGPAGARNLHELFTSLGTWIRDLAAVTGAREAPVLNRDAADWLREAAKRHGVTPSGVARSIEVVEEARAHAAGNVNPQLLLGGLLFELADILAEGSSAPQTPTP